MRLRPPPPRLPLPQQSGSTNSRSVLEPRPGLTRGGEASCNLHSAVPREPGTREERRGAANRTANIGDSEKRAEHFSRPEKSLGKVERASSCGVPVCAKRKGGDVSTFRDRNERGDAALLIGSARLCSENG
ncbi:hypothetical protein KM043_005485 [Ampulex compressa]|nr:hypothetical protein KM043_005485 [Ampulex compressa]